jgi:hypothetical protein
MNSLCYIAGSAKSYYLDAILPSEVHALERAGMEDEEDKPGLCFSKTFCTRPW